jgi:hypothetical protein
MDVCTRHCLKHGKQLQEKNLALWPKHLKKHRTIAVRKPRGFYKTTQLDYWLEAFVQIYPDMAHDERAARLTAMEGLEKGDGKGW